MMRSIVCVAPGELRLVRRPIPVAGKGEVLIRVRRVGVCCTDMHIFRGTQPYLRYPRVMGHEVAGEVVTAPVGAGLAPGDQVSVMPYISCGDCIACRKGKTNCCIRMQVLGVHRDGGMAEYLAVPERFVFKTEGISLDDAAMLEFLAIGARAVQRGAVHQRQRILVVGAGPIGAAVALFAAHTGAEVTVLDACAARLTFCRQVLNVDYTVIADECAMEELAGITAGDFFDVVFDATGSTEAMEGGLEFVAHGGVYVVVSMVLDRMAFSDPEFHKREPIVLGSRNATIDDFGAVVAAIRAGCVPTRLMNTHRATLDEFIGVLPQWMDPASGVLKAIVEL